VTLISANNESVTLFFEYRLTSAGKEDFRMAGPGRPAEEFGRRSYENYRSVFGVMAPFNVTRYFNGDMSSQRFLNSVTINQGLDPNHV